VPNQTPITFTRCPDRLYDDVSLVRDIPFRWPPIRCFAYLRHTHKCMTKLSMFSQPRSPCYHAIHIAMCPNRNTPANDRSQNDTIRLTSQNICRRHRTGIARETGSQLLERWSAAVCRSALKRCRYRGHEVCWRIDLEGFLCRDARSPKLCRVTGSGSFVERHGVNVETGRPPWSFQVWGRMQP
jgi:hypothetical protein